RRAEQPHRAPPVPVHADGTAARGARNHARFLPLARAALSRDVVVRRGPRGQGAFQGHVRLRAALRRTTMQATLTFMRCLALGAVLLALGGCSVLQEALNRIGDALAEGGTAFAADDDPELIR